MSANDLAERLGRLTPAQRALLEARLLHARETPPQPERPPRDPDATYPLASPQARLWLIQQLDPANCAFNVLGARRLRGPLNVTALERALDLIVARHESIRTRFFTVNGEPRQQVVPPMHLPLPQHDLRGLAPDEREPQARRIARELHQLPFALEHPPLLRAALVQLDDDDFVFLTVRHHIGNDAWSVGIFNRELAEGYRAYSLGDTPRLAPLPAQYVDFAEWQNERAQGEAFARELEFWSGELAGAPTLELTFDYARPPRLSYRGETLTLQLDGELTRALLEFSRREGVTLFMLLLAAFEVLLGRYARQDDFVIGTNVLGRDRAEFQDLIGFFSNTLPLRARPNGALSFRAFLTQTRRVVLDAFAHREVPFEKLVWNLRLPRDDSRNPLVQVLIQTTPVAAERASIPGLEVSPFPLDAQTTEFDLSLYVYENPAGLECTWKFSTDLFESATIRRLTAHFETLLRDIAARPDAPLDELRLITDAEEQQILVEWNERAVQAPLIEPLTLHARVEAQAARTPDAAALLYGGERLTYAELNARANRLAHQLRARGVSNESPVGVMLERSADAVVALLAILKAGGAFVPLEPTLPRERLAQMVADARPAAIVTLNQHLAALPATTAAVICLDRDAAQLAEASAENPNTAVDADALAYILFTSGSTGQPKGVLGLHRGMVNRLQWMERAYPFGADEVCCHKTALGFLDSVAEIFGPLSLGLPVLIVPPDAVRDPHLLVALLAQARVTRITLVPSLLRVLLNSPVDLAPLRALRLWISSGEPLDAELVQTFFKRLPWARLLNLYGASEASADSLYFELGAEWTKSRIPIGRPIANTTAFVLDARQQLAPIGVPGELVIGGVGLARGYLNLPAQTRERFVPAPAFVDAPTARVYRTGDLARYLPDGTIEYLGRTDNQVKVRGMRVELGEIEAALRSHPRVQDAAVAAVSQGADETRLAAFVVLGQPAPTTAELKEYLSARLSAYQVPSQFEQLDALPRTRTGKVDRRALAAREHTAGREHPVVLPHDEVERLLQVIWQRVLNLDSVGVTDDFFELGGHSLLAIVLFSEIEREFHKNLPVATLFEAPTIETLAAKLRDPQAAEWTPLVAIQPNGSKSPFFCVHGFGGGVVGYAQLARLMGQERPFIGLVARGQNGDAEPDRTIEAMAARYVAAIRALQPHGPYLLGGYCYGGTVAFEIAKVLTAAGESVAFLGMFENPAPKSNYRRMQLTPSYGVRFVSNLPYWTSDFMRLDMRRKWRYMVRELKNTTYYRRSRPAGTRERKIDLRDVLDDVAPIPMPHREMIQIHLSAIIRYQPAFYDGRVTVFRTRRQPLFCSHDPYLGWRELASQVDVRMIDGTHDNILEEPYVESLARTLLRALDEAERQAETKSGAQAA